ncbi:MAG: hypothetical protein JST94_11915 [Bacteroidetes bacterium]|nr:hypothetical protein [Bacteroidota bacterium]MBS1672132.1 hypothetical protein [Bacteroidota bacterium]
MKEWRAWTSAERSFLNENWKNYTPAEIGKALKRNATQVKSEAWKLGLRNPVGSVKINTTKPLTLPNVLLKQWEKNKKQPKPIVDPTVGKIPFRVNAKTVVYISSNATAEQKEALIKKYSNPV